MVCDVCGKPAMAFAPGGTPVHQLFLLDAGEPQRSWCRDHWPNRPPEDTKMERIKLPWDRLAMLRQFMADEERTRDTRKNGSSGWHNRLREWSTRLTEDGWIELTTISRGRHDSDMVWIAKAIMQRDIGGAQRHVHDVFVGTHKAFTGLLIKPKPPKGGGPRTRGARLPL